MISFLLWIFAAIPHFSFKFKWVSNNFDLDVTSEYAQSLILIAAACGVVSLLLFLTIVVTWFCKGCSKDVITAKSKRKVQRLTTILFVLTVSCFFFLGFCLIGNDQISKGVDSSVLSLKDVNRAFRLAEAQTRTLNTTCQNATLHLRQLEDVVHRESKKPGINQTLVSEIDSQLTSLSDNLDLVTDKLNGIQKILTGADYLEYANSWAERIEFDRWLALVFVLSIFICVLFVGVIAFCRKSKTGSVVFSGIGLLIFGLVCLVLILVLPFTVALSDFCSSGGTLIRSKLTPPMINTLEFYRTCDEKPTHDNVPPVMGATNVSDALVQIQTTKVKLDTLLDTTFNHSYLVSNTSAFISIDSTMSLKQIGALESSLACYTYKTDVLALHAGVCNRAVVGSSILTLCLLMLVIFLFVLLLIVSKTWKLYSRLVGNPVRVRPFRYEAGAKFLTPTLSSLDATTCHASPHAQLHPITSTTLKRVSFRPSDYVEVDGDDPFIPRFNDSNIPVDIYGTHVFNPRTRDRVEASSTNTTTATAPGADEQAPLWNRTSNSGSGNRPMFPDFVYGNYADQQNI